MPKQINVRLTDDNIEALERITRKINREYPEAATSVTRLVHYALTEYLNEFKEREENSHLKVNFHLDVMSKEQLLQLQNFLREMPGIDRVRINEPIVKALWKKTEEERGISFE